MPTDTATIRAATEEIAGKTRRVDQTTARVKLLRADLERVRTECAASEEEDRIARDDLRATLAAFTTLVETATPPPAA